MNIRSALNLGKSQLGDGEDLRRDAEILLGAAAGKKRFELYAASRAEVSREVFDRYRAFIEMRRLGVPVDYILGRTEFMSLSLYAEPGVFIPRRETEILVEAALRRLGPDRKALEIGTGSGNIAVSAARYAGCRVFASDVSAEAVDLAKRNAALNGVSRMIEFFRGDMFEPFGETGEGTFDMIISNPPYVRTKDIEALQLEISGYEPEEALDGGEDGMRFFRLLCEKGRYFLKPGGVLLMETGSGQAGAVGGLLEERGFMVEFFRDYSGVTRVAEGVLP